MAREVRALAVSYGGYAVSLGSTALLVPTVIHHLGDSGYGLWTLTFSLVSLLSLLEGGLATAWLRYVTQARQQDALRYGLSTALRLYLGVVAAGLLVLLALSPFWPHWSGWPAAYSLPLLWLLAARQFYAILPLALFRVILFGQHRTVPAQSWGTLHQLIYTLLAWLWLRNSGGILGLAAINLGVALVEHLGYLAMCRRWCQGLTFGWSHYRPDLAREFKTQALAGMVVQLASLVLLKTDPLLVKALLPLESVALYGVALKVGENFLILLKQFLPILTPQLGAASTDPVRLRALILRASCWSTIPALALALPFWVGGQSFLLLWVGPAYVQAWPSLCILLLAALLSLPQMVVSSALAMTGRLAVNARAALLAVVINPLASLGWAWWLGLEGIALGTLTATLWVDLWVVLRYGSKTFEIRPGQWLQGMALAHGLSLAVVVPLLVLTHWLVENHLALWLVWASAGGGLYLLISLAQKRAWSRLP